jgi:uncharacterized protein YigA (DUF484 family)
VTAQEHVNDESVARFLRENPDYFQRYPGLLTLLQLPHTSGQAVSLVERQVALLRERNIDMRKRLTQLVGTASTNDSLFDKTRSLTLALLDVEDFAGLDAVIEESLRTGFKADDVACFVSQREPIPELRHVHRVDDTRDLPMINLTQSTGAACGPLRADEYRRLFHVADAGDASAAIVQLRHRDLVGILAIGSHDPRRFSPDMGTLFVRYIADVLARLIVRLSARNAAD